MICVVGADGFFGSYITRLILEKKSDAKLVTLNHNSPVFDVSENKTDILFELHDKDSIKNAVKTLSCYNDIRILFLASVHNPDAVKKDPEKAEYINTVCYEYFLDAIKGLDVKKLIYASSDTVYGESRDGYVFSEKDTPSPINIYGKQKLLAEEITRKHNFTVARFSYMCAPSLTPRKKHFFDSVAETLSSGEKMPMLTDWIRPALSYSTSAEITYDLLLRDNDKKTINICSDTPYSKYDIGIKIAEHIGADKGLLIPCTKKELNIFSEKRADSIIIDNSLLKKITNRDTIEFKF